MKALWFLLLFATSAWGQQPEVPLPTYKGETLSIAIEDTEFQCDSTDTVKTTIYCWTYTQNRWFARVQQYYDQDFTNLQAKYLAHMALGPDQNWLAIFTGNYYDYRRNGKLESVVFYEEGLRNGPARFYNRFGYLKQEGLYSQDMRAGIWRFYDKKGNFKYEVDYKKPPEPIKLTDFQSPQPPPRP
jgi:hypothetical protein